MVVISAANCNVNMKEDNVNFFWYVGCQVASYKDRVEAFWRAVVIEQQNQLI